MFSTESVIATPYSLCWTDTFLAGVARTAIKSIVDALKGRLPEHIVNRAAIDHPRVAQWRRPEPNYEARKGEKAEKVAELNPETRRNGRMPRARFRKVGL
jgi:hypothetical protein